MVRPFIIGIAGGSGSGKTFFLKCLQTYFSPGEVAVISQDDYYRHVADNMTREENKCYNFDLPATIDHEHFENDILKLINGDAILKKEYNFHNPAFKTKMLEIRPAPVLLVEGLFVFYFRKIAELLDMKIFLEAEERVALKRRVERDGAVRGYSYDDVIYKWLNHVRPAYQQYLVPYRHLADHVVVNNTNVAADMMAVTAALAQQVKEQVLRRSPGF